MSCNTQRRPVAFEPKEIPLTGSKLRTNLKICVKGASKGFAGETKSDVLVVVMQQGEGSSPLTIPAEIDEATGGLCQELVTTRKWNGRSGNTITTLLPPGKHFKEMILIGLGKFKNEQYSIVTGFDKDEGKLTPNQAYKAGKSLAAPLNATRRTSATVVIDSPLGNAENLGGFIEGLLSVLSLEERQRFKGKPASGSTTTEEDSSANSSVLKELTFVVKDVTDAEVTKKVIEKAFCVAEGEQITRELVDTPPNYCNPETLGAFAKLFAQNCEGGRVQARVFGRKECEDMKMGAYLSVNQGSMYEPNFIHLTYKFSEKKAKRVVVLIGKGITMDTGGYNLKSAASSIHLMKFDMAGAAAVLGAAHIISKLKPEDVEVHFIIAAAENMVSSTATRPGDVVVAGNGKTIVVNNTDAEGRLTLADALVYAEREIPQADSIIDCATLTGAIIVGLGAHVGAVYSTNTGLMNQILGAAQESGTPLWPMPLFSDYEKGNEFPLVDISNTSSFSHGGSITAALFLRQFVDKKPWAHIDLAGPVFDNKWATGYGARLLADLVMKNNQ